MRARPRERRLCLMLLAVGALLGACGPEPHWNTEEESPWDAAQWRQRLEAHAEATARVLPVLSAAAQAEDPGAYRDTLQVVYASLQVAEESVPPIPRGIELSDAELHSKYRSAVRELRYGAEVMLESLITREEGRHDEARYFINRGSRLFQAIREQMEQV
ncbi:MAG TPA: hypothetical protein VGR27_14285, partial [Longimicrobiaceae bacterium]|nr:hypothetical protein [Longimicrobiaceae bacterium]